MRITHLLGLCAGLLISQQVLAHETIPANWCTAADEAPAIISTFEFNESELIELQQSLKLHLHPPTHDDHSSCKCGIVDAWRLVQQITKRVCQLEASEELLPMPYVTGPHNFIDEQHHQLYRISDGVQGSCVVCVTQK